MIGNVLYCNVEDYFEVIRHYRHTGKRSSPFCKDVMRYCENHARMIVDNDTDVNSILIELSGQTATSETIIKLERKIMSLKDVMSGEQKNLNTAATSILLNKEERNATIAESTVKIEELRKEINSAKIDLHKILLQVYR